VNETPYTWLKKHYGSDGKYTFGFQLQEDDGFKPPKSLVGCREESAITLNLADGIHYFHTAVEKRKPSWGLLADFASATYPNQSPHRFIGESLSVDSERAVNLSSDFARMLGIGLMTQHAKATWFAPLPKSGKLTMKTKQ